MTDWLADVDSNHDLRGQDPLSCHWTICQAPVPEAGGLPITLRPDELNWGERPESNRH